MSIEVGHCVDCCKVMNDAGHFLCTPTKPNVRHLRKNACMTCTEFTEASN